MARALRLCRSSIICCFEIAKRGRASLNIGGIANVTVVPARASAKDVFAFDTGPGNMIVDALVERITRGRATYDRDARIALSGRTIQELLARLMREPYLRKRPPKTTGRELFGQAYAARVDRLGQPLSCSAGRPGAHGHNVHSPFDCRRLPRLILPRAEVHELIVTGGGAKNPLMMAQLAASLPGIAILPANSFGVPPEAKEAFAFAVLAYETYHGRPNNIPSATGAKHATVLGKTGSGRGSAAECGRKRLLCSGAIASCLTGWRVPQQQASPRDAARHR